jgi:hypothetical protein
MKYKIIETLNLLLSISSREGLVFVVNAASRIDQGVDFSVEKFE